MINDSIRECLEQIYHKQASIKTWKERLPDAEKALKEAQAHLHQIKTWISDDEEQLEELLIKLKGSLNNIRAFAPEAATAGALVKRMKHMKAKAQDNIGRDE